MSCLGCKFERVGGTTASFTRVTDFTARFALVCGSDIGYEFLYASDGILLTIDGGKIMVKKMR